MNTDDSYDPGCYHSPTGRQYEDGPDHWAELLECDESPPYEECEGCGGLMDDDTYGDDGYCIHCLEEAGQDAQAAYYEAME